MTSSVSMVLYVKYEGKYNINNRGILGNTKGSAFVVYEDPFDARSAVEHLNGFNVGGRYLIVLYFQRNRENNPQPTTTSAAPTIKDIEELKKKYHI